MAVTTQGISALSVEDTNLLISEMETERCRRLADASRRRDEQEARRKSREAEIQRATMDAEAQAKAELDLLAEMRTRKLKAWNDNVLKRELRKSQEKQELRDLIAKQEASKTARVVACRSIRGSGIAPPARHQSAKTQRYESQSVSPNSHFCELPRVVVRLRRPPDPSQERYEGIMEETNYARSIELASSVYSKKLTGKRR